MDGYPTMKPCCVCGKVFHNLIEPRFGYTVCQDHYNTSPTEISNEKE